MSNWIAKLFKYDFVVVSFMLPTYTASCPYALPFQTVLLQVKRKKFFTELSHSFQYSFSSDETLVLMNWPCANQQRKCRKEKNLFEFPIPDATSNLF